MSARALKSRAVKKLRGEEQFFGGINRLVNVPRTILRMAEPSPKKDLQHDRARLKWLESLLERASPDREPEIKNEILRLKKKIVVLEKSAKAPRIAIAARKAAA